jgi:hypothetical protein
MVAGMSEALFESHAGRLRVRPDKAGKSKITNGTAFLPGTMDGPSIEDILSIAAKPKSSLSSPFCQAGGEPKKGGSRSRRNAPPATRKICNKDLG